MLIPVKPDINRVLCHIGHHTSKQVIHIPAKPAKSFSQFWHSMDLQLPDLTGDLAFTLPHAGVEGVL